MNIKDSNHNFIFIIILTAFGVYWFFAISNTDKQNNNVLQNVSSTFNNLFNNGITEPTPPPPLVQSARKQIGVTVTYNPEYVSLDYPMGDVPQSKGVCTDVIVRAYRHHGKDLQVLIHEDMKKAWRHYPKIWDLKKPDKNIDHRRVPNLRVFFKRHGTSLTVSKQADDYKAGDVVTWKIKGLPHIGIVSSKITRDGIPLIIHNIGRGTQENNILFKYPITGHYRY